MLVSHFCHLRILWQSFTLRASRGSVVGIRYSVFGMPQGHEVIKSPSHTPNTIALRGNEGFSLSMRMLRMISAFIALGILAVSAADRPNIVVIMADDIGVECLSAYGSKMYQTPNLDQFFSTLTHVFTGGIGAIFTLMASR